MLSFFRQQRPFIRPADETQSWPTALPFRTVPPQRSHTCGYKSSRRKQTNKQKKVINNNIPTHPRWHPQLLHIHQNSCFAMICGSDASFPYSGEDYSCLRCHVQVLPAAQTVDNLRKNINSRSKQAPQVSAGCTQLSFSSTEVI